MVQKGLFSFVDQSVSIDSCRVRKQPSWGFKVLKWFLEASDRRDSSALCMLDLSVAFDTVYHARPLKRLQLRFGVICKALQWIRSYLTNRTFKDLPYRKVAYLATYFPCFDIQSCSHVFLSWTFICSLRFSFTVELNKSKLLARISSSESLEAMLIYAICRTFKITVTYEMLSHNKVARQNRTIKSPVWHRLEWDLFESSNDRCSTNDMPREVADSW